MFDPYIESIKRRESQLQAKHNIDPFLDNRSISDNYLAELCNMDVTELQRILSPANDPLISELVVIHQGLLRITDCTLEEIINPDAEISPDKQQIFDLERLREIGQEIIKSLYSDLNGTPLEVIVQKDNKADAFKRFGIDFIKHSSDMIDGFRLHKPRQSLYLSQPRGYFRLNNILQCADEKGKRNLTEMKDKFMSLPERARNSEAYKGNMKIARYIFNPYQDFKLSQLSAVHDQYFRSNADNGVSISDLIFSPDRSEKQIFESSKTRFKSGMIILGQIAQGLINSNNNSSRYIKTKLSHIETMMGLIEPDWQLFASGNDFSRRGPRSGEESIRHLRPIKEADLKDAYFSS